MTSISTHNNYQCDVEVQPPTPIMCTGTFSEYAEAADNTQNQDQQAYLQPSAKNQLLRQNSSHSTGSFAQEGGSFDLSAADDSASSSSHMTHDPYMQRSSSNNSRCATPNRQNQFPAPQQMEEYNGQEQQQFYRQQQYYQYEEPQQMQQQQPQQYNGQQLPPSLQQASQGRQRSQSNEDLFPANGHPYPQQQQQQRSTASSFVAHSTQGQQQQHPQTQTQQGNSAHSEKPFPECCHHKALVNRMEFIQPPSSLASAGNFQGNTRSTNYLRVFVGQCRFEATPAELRWLIHYLTNVQPVKVELRGTGCFMAYVQSYEEVTALLQLKEKLLFDHTGVWYAREEEQASFLRGYVRSYVSGVGKGFRLPKDMMVLHDQQKVQQQQRHNQGNGMRSYQNQNQQHGNGNYYGGAPRGGQNNRSFTNNFYQQQQQF